MTTLAEAVLVQLQPLAVAVLRAEPGRARAIAGMALVRQLVGDGEQEADAC